MDNICFSSVRKIIMDNRTCMLKIANNKEREITIEQINYLLKLPNSLKEFFPEILSYDINEEQVHYIMPYYNMPTLDEVLRTKKISLHEIQLVLKQLIHFMFTNVYTRKQTTPPNDLIKKQHLDRIDKRLKFMYNTQKNFQYLIDSKELQINNKKYLNYPYILEEIEKHGIIKQLNPNFIGLIHGDLEANHIMFNIEGSQIKLRLLDPRFPKGGGDIAYDMGKLWQCLNGLSHEIQTGNFILDIIQYSNTTKINFSINSTLCLADYNYLKNSIIDSLEEHMTTHEVEKLLLRTEFAEAVHFLSAPPFFVGDNFPDYLAEALYIQGIIKINDFYHNYINYKNKNCHIIH